MLQRLRMCRLVCVACVLAAPSVAEDKPEETAASAAVLFCTPRGVGSSPGVDLVLLREMYDAGFQTDYLDHLRDFTWERIRQYNVLVLVGAPHPEAKRHFASPGS